MYSRVYDDKTLSFEASGGLVHSSLVLQDFETDSYWAIMEGEAIGGKLKGTKLIEIPVSKKVQWKDWVKEHPETLVLSVNGEEDARQVYADYFSSERGFRGERAKDKRLSDKEPIYAFTLGGNKYAVPLKSIEGGKSFETGESNVFFYRPKGADMFYSTVAFESTGKGFLEKNGKWMDVASGCVFNPESETFESSDGKCPPKIAGFDTFWYNWSLNNPETVLLNGK